MKTKTAIFSLLFCLACIFSLSTFGQTAPGGGFDCPNSYSIKKNNGGGICHGDALVTVIFNPMPLPGDIPMLTAIYCQGQPLNNILPAQGYLTTKDGEINVTYCLTESTDKKTSVNNISPSSKLVLEFTYSNGMVCRTDNTN
jgi:hypothetical protein